MRYLMIIAVLATAPVSADTFKCVSVTGKQYVTSTGCGSHLLSRFSKAEGLGIKHRPAPRRSTSLYLHRLGYRTDVMYHTRVPRYGWKARKR